MPSRRLPPCHRPSTTKYCSASSRSAAGRGPAATAAASGPCCSRTAAPSPPAAGRTFPRGAASSVALVAQRILPDTVSFRKSKKCILFGRQSVAAPRDSIVIVVVVVLGGIVVGVSAALSPTTVAWC